MKDFLLDIIGGAIAVVIVLVLEAIYIIQILLNIPDEHNPD